MHKKLMVLTSVLVVSLMITGCGAQTKTEDTVVTETQVIPVEVADVVSADVYNSIYGIGEVAASDVYQVNALAGGKVVDVLFEVGDVVNEGDILFTIEADDFDVDMSSKLSQSKNGVTQAQISLTSSEDNYTRTKSLYESGISSKAEYDNAKSAYDNAKITYSNAYKSYESLKYALDSQSENYVVTSPVTGIITDKTIVKDMMASSQNGMTVSVVDEYKITSKIGSKYINGLEMGQEVEVYISTLDTIMSGTIESISLSGVNGTYPIEIVLEESAIELKSGMYAEYWIIVDRTSNGLWIPSLALMQENGESFVYTVVDGKAEKIMVEVLSKRGEDMAIKSNLSKEQQVITFGKEYVMQGTDVEIK